MKVNGNELRPGNIIQHQGRLWVVRKTQHTQPGKGGAYMQAELKDIRDGTKLNERFRASETVERVRLDEKEFQYLYPEGDMLAFMDQETYEQISIPSDLVGDPVVFLQDGMLVTIHFYEDEPLAVTLPEHVVLEVTETEPTVKGQTAAASYKPAVLDNGVRTMVPPHIDTGTRVVINTADGTYVERAKD